ncbi:alkaline phosphatase [Dyadobacter psychrotolerans]|uniref:Alkaline phosphatase n=1 Tax=Dyadobacter psychrotolerans TaxID=2541721 RepID=A0A4R5DR70_9BACT|nr:alkaline phosphatase [Dyadobacter psychrotolerans]TDE14710.1 alkaline phosphatase [Dyadobacter psychrotolerans]
MKISVFFTCLILLSGFCCYSQNIFKRENNSPKNVILMIGDGMGTSQIYAGMVANKNTLNLERAQFIGFHKNQSADSFITDSAAGATALSIGKKTKNSAVGVDADGKPQMTILEAAEKKGLATGMVVTCSMTHATPASFIAHQPYRGLTQEIAADFLKTDIDVFIGGGRNDFDKRKDGLNLIDSLKAHDYQIAGSILEVQKIKSGKMAGFLADKEPPRFSAGRADQLSKSADAAIDILKQNKKGFFLMVEGSQIDWGGHTNNLKYITEEVVDFDKVIGQVFDFAQKDGNTLVIITADHETGGLSIRGGSTKTGEIKGSFSTKKHTGVMIPVFAFGPGAEAFAGIYENTAIFDKMIEALRLK